MGAVGVQRRGAVGAYKADSVIFDSLGSGVADSDAVERRIGERGVQFYQERGASFDDGIVGYGVKGHHVVGIAAEGSHLYILILT